MRKTNQQIFSVVSHRSRAPGFAAPHKKLLAPAIFPLFSISYATTTRSSRMEPTPHAECELEASEP
jgi:hypothetical protein